MNRVLGHNSALQAVTGPGTTWVNEMNLEWIMPQMQDRSLNLLTGIQRATTVLRMPK